MKKSKIEIGKLTLNKKKISVLNSDKQMAMIKGGYTGPICAVVIVIDDDI